MIPEVLTKPQGSIYTSGIAYRERGIKRLRKANPWLLLQPTRLNTTNRVY